MVVCNHDSVISRTGQNQYLHSRIVLHIYTRWAYTKMQLRDARLNHISAWRDTVDAASIWMRRSVIRYEPSWRACRPWWCWPLRPDPDPAPERPPGYTGTLHLQTPIIQESLINKTPKPLTTNFRWTIFLTRRLTWALIGRDHRRSTRMRNSPIRHYRYP